jgi:hypothetical protein
VGDFVDEITLALQTKDLSKGIKDVLLLPFPVRWLQNSFNWKDQAGRTRKSRRHDGHG